MKTTKKDLGPKSDQTSQNYVFRNFLKFGLLVLLEIAYNGNLQQFMKLTEKKIGDPKLGFLSFSQLWLVSFTLNCIG